MNRANRRAAKFGHRRAPASDQYARKLNIKVGRGQTVIITERNKETSVIDTAINKKRK